MNPKVKAKRKFAQRPQISQPVTPTVTPSTSNERRTVEPNGRPTVTPSTSNERRTVEPNGRSANIHSNNTSASRLLDELALRHLGKHKIHAKVMLRRLSESYCNNGAAIVSRSPAQKVPDLCNNCTQLNRNTYFLRSRSVIKTDKVIKKTRPRKQGRPGKSNCSPKPTRQRSPVHETDPEVDIPLSAYISTKRKTKDNIRSSKRHKACETTTTANNTRSERHNTCETTTTANNTRSERHNTCETTTTANSTEAETPDAVLTDSSEQLRLVFMDDNENLGGWPIRNTPMFEIENNEEELIDVETVVSPNRENNEEELIDVETVVPPYRENNEEELIVVETVVPPYRENNEEVVGVHATSITVPIAGSNERLLEVTLLKEENDEENDDSFFIRDSNEPNNENCDNSDFPNLENNILDYDDPGMDPDIKCEDEPSTSSGNRPQATAKPSRITAGVVEEAPTYYLNEEDFSDPLVFYEKIHSCAKKYGIFKVVPPDSFQPKCCLRDLVRVAAKHQYVGRLYKRWGTGTREMCAIRANLAYHNVIFSRPPLLDGLEVDLPKIYRTVQKHGGFAEVTRNQQWTCVAEAMNFLDILDPGKRLNNLYVKYILPYDVMSPADREALISKLDLLWHKKYTKLLKLAEYPLRMQNAIIGDSESSSEEEFTEEETFDQAMYEVPTIDKTTRPILVSNFQKINHNAMRMFFPRNRHGPTVKEVEEFYWRKVTEASDHICVHSASVDTTDGHGFSTEDQHPISTHKWNLKNFRKNNANILKALGPLVSVTTPVLQMGMLFSTHCWHKDPHGLPWVEYHHEGNEKIWYSIADIQSGKFRRAVQKLCPSAVQNKSMWLTSDLVMIPPDLLLKEGVSLTKTIQKPGEFIFVLPGAYTSSICTGLTTSESVYFAQESWLNDVNEILIKLRDNCEPMIFPPEHLLLALYLDPNTSPQIQQKIYSNLWRELENELKARIVLDNFGIVQEFVEQSYEQLNNWNCKENECDICRRPLYFSKILGRFHKQILTKMCINHCQYIMEREHSDEWNITLIIFVSDEYLKSVMDKLSEKFKKNTNAPDTN